MKHAIISRAKFNDKNVRDKYYKIAKKILVPALKSQTEQNYDWILFINEEDVEYTKNHFKIDFFPICNIPNLVDDIKGNQIYSNWLTKYMKKNKYNIQTRHDIDDWMSPYYVQEIQKIYKENITNHNEFLVQTQPNRFNYKEKTKEAMFKYNNTRTSMFLSLCQKDVDKHIFVQKHAQMWKSVPKLFTIPEGYVEWISHSDNITYKHKEYNIPFGKKRGKKRRKK